MLIMRGHKLRIYPTAQQKELLSKYFGCARWVYNNTLADVIDTNCYFDMKFHGRRIRDFTWPYANKDFKPWLKEAPSTVITQSLRDLERAFKNLKEGRAKFPKFKKKSHTQSIRFQLDQRIIKTYFSPGKLLKVPKLGELKVRWHEKRLPTSNPGTVTITKEATGRYHVSFMCEEEIKVAPKKEFKVGVDLGINDVFVCSNSYKSGSPKYFRKYQRRLKLTQRKLKRKKKLGTRRRERIRQRVAKIHNQIKYARRNFIHNQINLIVKSSTHIALEDLAVKNMMKNSKLAKSIADSSFSFIKTTFEYKAAWYGSKIVIINRFVPTSKLCHVCKNKNSNLKLHHRSWTCSNCGTNHDRDINAARNIYLAAVSYTHLTLPTSREV